MRSWLEVLFLRIENGEIKRWLKELQERIAFNDEVNDAVWSLLAVNLPQRLTQQRHAFGEIALFGTKPEGTVRSCSKKARAVGPACWICFPGKRARMIIGRATAKFSVLCADAVAKLRDLSRDELRLRQSGNQVADKLRLADAACVSANHNEAIDRGFGLFSLCQLLPLAL